MSTLQEIEKAVIELTPVEKRELLRVLASHLENEARQSTELSSARSLETSGLGMPGIDAGKILRPFSRAELLDEMLEKD